MKNAAVKSIRNLIRRTGFDVVRCSRDQDFHDIYETFRDYTMIPPPIYVQNIKLAQTARSVSGAVVECGTWRGGMIAGIASLYGSGREYFLYDSFEGLPEVEPIDGPAAKDWQDDKESPTYFDNCTASEDEAKSAMSLANIQNANIVKGWFEDTLPNSVFPNGIAILRMDADWYKSTRQILDSLFPSVNENGLIIIDDYYTWDGCSKAVHDYLSEHKRPERINSFGGVCFIKKNAVEQDAAEQPATSP